MTLRRRLGNLSDRIDGVATSSAARVSFSRRVVCRIFWSKKKENNLEWNEFPMHAVEHFPESRFYCQNKKEQKKDGGSFPRGLIDFYRVLPIVTEFRRSTVSTQKISDTAVLLIAAFFMSIFCCRIFCSGRTTGDGRRRRRDAGAPAPPRRLNRPRNAVAAAVCRRWSPIAAGSGPRYRIFFFPRHRTRPHRRDPVRKNQKRRHFYFTECFFCFFFFLKKKGGG